MCGHIEIGSNIMRDKLIFINSTLDGSVHEIVDASMIEVFSGIYDTVIVHFLQKRSSIIESLSNYSNNVYFLPSKNIKKTGALKDLIASVLDAIYLIRADNNTTIYYSSVNMFSVHLINFILKFLNRKVIICCHSELEIVKKQSYKKTDYWSFLIKRMFCRTKINKNLRFMVLGSFILENLKKYICEQRLIYFFSFEHPYFNVRNNLNHIVNFSSKIQIGIIGNISPNPSRGVNNIKNFANQIKGYDFIELSILGKIDANSRVKLPNNIIYKNESNSFIPRDQYVSMIEDLDYIFIPYPEDSFSLSVSGVVLEAISEHKPVLMYRTDYFMYLIDKYGQFGLFIEDYSISDLVIALQDQEQYYKFVNTEKIISKNIMPNNLQKTYLDVSPYKI